MGRPVKILNLARHIIHLIGYEVKSSCNASGDIEAIFNRLCSGKNLYDELVISNNNIEAIQHSLIMQTRKHSFKL